MAVHYCCVLLPRCLDCVGDGGVIVLRDGQRIRVDVEDLIVYFPKTVAEYLIYSVVVLSSECRA